MCVCVSYIKHHTTQYMSAPYLFTYPISAGFYRPKAFHKIGLPGPWGDAASGCPDGCVVRRTELCVLQPPPPTSHLSSREVT